MAYWLRGYVNTRGDKKVDRTCPVKVRLRLVRAYERAFNNLRGFYFPWSGRLTTVSDYVQRIEARDAWLEHLRTAHREVELAIAHRQVMVQQARRFGATWQHVGDALGMTRQGAHKLFGTADDTRE